MIKAIETVYDGYRFRSRLEARWAVFFNELGVEFHYEPEGYILPSGKYLPDFFIPSERSFVEIKPGPMPRDYLHRTECRFAFDLMEMTGKSVYIFYGDPVEALAPGYPGMSGFHAPDDDFSLSFLHTHSYHGPALKARQARFEHGQVGAPA